jgi:hypothetical protein
MSFLKIVEIEILMETLTKIKIYQDFRVIETVETWILNCQDFLNMLRCPFQTVEIETLKIETNRDPQAYEISALAICHCFFFFFVTLLFKKKIN